MRYVPGVAAVLLLSGLPAIVCADGDLPSTRARRSFRQIEFTPKSEALITSAGVAAPASGSQASPFSLPRFYTYRSTLQPPRDVTPRYCGMPVYKVSPETDPGMVTRLPERQMKSSPGVMPPTVCATPDNPPSARAWRFVPVARPGRKP